MELRHLRYFLAVAAEGNFTRAAQQLGIGQPPLSQQIKSLERELGVDLFRRTAHGVVLTAAGLAFQVEAARVIEDARRAVRVAQLAGEGETGHVRIGFTGSATFNPRVPALILKLKSHYPAVELTLEESNTPVLVDRLLQDQLDAAFVRPGKELLAGLRLHPLPDEPMKIVVPASHPLAAKKRAPLASLANERFVLASARAGTTLNSEIVEACLRSGFTPTIVQQAPQIASVINLVAAGLGVSIVPAALEQVHVNGVRYLDIQGTKVVARLALATRADDVPPIVQNLVHMLAH